MEIKGRGIDVSKHQGKIDWDKVKPQIDFAILRCGFGTDLKSQDDKQFLRNAEECERLGIPYGVYLFSYASSVENAISEANHTIRLLKGRKISLPVFYDLEDTRTTGNCNNALILEMAKCYVDKIKAAGYECGIYSNKYWRTTKLVDKWYDSIPLWLAQYNNCVTYKGDYIIWQYSSTGKVSGITGNVDMNYAYVDFNKPINSPTPAPTTTPKKTVDELAKEVIDGKWGNGQDRVNRLTKAGYDAKAVQAKVNAMLSTKPSTNTSKPVTKVYTKGQKVILVNAPLYASADAKSYKHTKTGTFYIYDGVKLNGRYRITNKPANCGKKPVGLFTTGWIAL